VKNGKDDLWHMPVHMTDRVRELKGPSGSKTEAHFMNALLELMRRIEVGPGQAVLLKWPVTFTSGRQELLMVYINTFNKEVEICFPEEGNPALVANSVDVSGSSWEAINSQLRQLRQPN
jgi:hypothetical protein